MDFIIFIPKKIISLFQQIVKKGLVISEYPPNVTPKRYHFPERNRIISGLRYATLVIEATEKSGTFITVDQALRSRKRSIMLFQVHHFIQKHEGCHQIDSRRCKICKMCKRYFRGMANIMKSL